MLYTIKIDTQENLKTFLVVIDDRNTLALSKEVLFSKLDELFDLKIKEFDKYEVPLHLRDFSIFVELKDFNVSDWAIYNKFSQLHQIFTVESFIANDYKNAIPKFAKLYKIPIPSCYKNISYEDSYIELYREEIEKFRDQLPDFSHWSDSQIVAFGEDYSDHIDLTSSFQGAHPETTRDVVLAMVLYDLKMDKVSYNTSYFNDSGLDVKGAYGLYKLLAESRPVTVN